METERLENERLDALVRQVRDLPALPDTVVRVIHLTDDPKSGIADVAKALVSDQALAARVLKLANSAFYGASRRIATVSDAVVILGMRTTRNLVMASGCQEMLEQEVAGYALPRGALLRHSLACASAAQALAKRTHYRGTEEAFVAGLLHDLGKVVMNSYLRDQFIQVLLRAASGEISYPEAERAVFSFDHAEAGAYLLERWNLPSSLVAAVRYHHTPLEAPTDSPLPCLVHVADAICLTLGIGLGLDGLAYVLQPEALTRLHLTAEDFEEVASQTCDMLTQAGQIF
jgi:putative nucleotidyltransferase with HDIG domain